MISFPRFPHLVHRDPVRPFWKNRFLAGILLLAPAGVFAQFDQGTPVIVSDGIVQRAKRTYHTQPGPWGDLEYYHTYLEAPDALIDLVPVPSQQTVWRFPGFAVDDVRNLFLDAGLNPDLLAELNERSVWHISADGVRVHPADRIIAEMPIGARLRIYQILRGFEENRYHRSPVIIESGDVSSWFADTGISPHAIEAINRLAYPIGASLAFSDLPYLLGLMSSEEEERKLIKATTRTRSLILRLRVHENTDFRSLQDYWTAGFKYKDILPLLESVQRTDGVERIDVAHLIPPLPRKLLYTFPSLSLGLSGRYPDSFWTALNFFEFWPQEKFLNSSEVEKEIRSRFSRVAPPFRYGDVLTLIDPVTRRVAHMCVYLADDIVYTKNGPGVLRPWIFMRMADLVTRLETEQAPVVEGWRRIEDGLMPPGGTTPGQ